MASQRETRGVVIGVHELTALRKRFEKLSDAMKQDPWLAKEIGELVANSARRRITTTKVAPTGKRWQPWSKRYAKTATKNPNHTMLLKTGALRDSITYVVHNAGEVEVGSPLVYAPVHLHGSEDIPARPYMDTSPGFSDPADRADMRELVREFLRRGLGK